MNLRTWRLAHGVTLASAAEALGLVGGARSVHRLETGENNSDADIVERIAAFTAGEVTAADMHATRLAWLRENRPDKLASLPVAGPDASQAGAGNPSSGLEAAE